MTREESIEIYDELCTNDDLKIPCCISTSVSAGDGYIIDVDCIPVFPVFTIEINKRIEIIPCIGVMRK